MLTRDAFHKKFGRHAVFGMVHLKALPGAPLFAGSIGDVIDGALRDARAWCVRSTPPARRVACALKRGGDVAAEVDQARVERLVRAFKAAAYR